MAHQEQRAWCEQIRAKFPDAFTGKRVLDIGSQSVNGDNRYLFIDCEYVGLDVVAGPNVDVVEPAHLHHVPDGHYDTIISTETLEHDLHWMLTLTAIERMLKSGGLFLFTAATTGRASHGTTASKPFDSPGLPWPDYYRNITADDVRWRLNDLEHWSSHEFAENRSTCDVYGWLIRA